MPVAMLKGLMMTAEVHAVKTTEATMETAKAATMETAEMPACVRRGFNGEKW